MILRSFRHDGCMIFNFNIEKPSQNFEVLLGDLSDTTSATGQYLGPNFKKGLRRFLSDLDQTSGLKLNYLRGYKMSEKMTAVLCLVFSVAAR